MSIASAILAFWVAQLVHSWRTWWQCACCLIVTKWHFTWTWQRDVHSESPKKGIESFNKTIVSYLSYSSWSLNHSDCKSSTCIMRGWKIAATINSWKLYNLVETKNFLYIELSKPYQIISFQWVRNIFTSLTTIKATSFHINKVNSTSFICVIFFANCRKSLQQD